MGFSSEIRQARKQCYLSQEELAEILNVSFSTVNRWENGKFYPNYKTMKRLLLYFKKMGINVDSLEECWLKENNN